MEHFRRGEEMTSSKDDTSFVYDILSEGHLQATAHRSRSYSMHVNRPLVHDNSAKNRKGRPRRMSLPANVTRLHKERRSKVAAENEPGQTKVHEMDEEEETWLSRNRRARSFKEHSEKIECQQRRIRSFKTTSKGLVNRGDSFEVKLEEDYNIMDAPTTTPDSTHHTNAIRQHITNKYHHDKSYFRVLLTGARDVGKTSLIEQFAPPHFLAQSEGDRTVTLQVDGEKSTLEFVQSEDFQDQDENLEIDAFVVVYCITDRATFDIAIDLLTHIRDEVGSNKAIILVGNKSDLERKRTISQEEGRSAADACGCKYIELSAALNHRVDELLVGIHKQIKLKSEADNEETESRIPKAKERRSSFKRTKRFLEKVFHRHSSKDKTTENLYVE
ncbi:GTP-binding protein GEM-like [Mercenaria mercenaria]|uniref:GTP-binding protein GEM-like n=1 Tax=Mercenaria mercenaria TaxID=6596 RepID=UPI00234FB099|nr:GTP-binding protein GEM-like [Mercenaria mercenaria]